MFRVGIVLYIQVGLVFLLYACVYITQYKPFVSKIKKLLSVPVIVMGTLVWPVSIPALLIYKFLLWFLRGDKTWKYS